MKSLLIFAISSFLFSNLYSQDDKDATISALREEIKSLYQINDELRTEIKSLKSQTSQMVKSGEEFRVQLGILNDMIESLHSPKTMSGTNVNGKMVYDIGGFMSSGDAYKLSQEIRRLDLKGAFVTRYVNGVRDYDYDFRSDASKSRSVRNEYISSMEAAKSSNNYNYERGAVSNDNLPPAKKSKSLVIEE